MKHLIIVIGLALVLTGIAQAQGVTLLFRDDFNGSVSSLWEITNENSAMYSLTENPGNLRVYTTPTDVWGGHNNLVNLFTFPFQEGIDSFTVTTKISLPILPYSHPQQTGIILLGKAARFPDMDNYVRVTYGYIDGSRRLQRAYEINGNPNDTSYWGPSLDIGTNPVWIRIVKSGDSYNAYYSLDGINFDLFNSFNASLTVAYIGLGAFHSEPYNQSIPVDFDYFEIIAALPTQFKLPDTGQTTCYDQVGNVISCPAPGQPLAQDGSYNINPLSYTDNGNGTVTDNNTGLMWQQEDDGNIYNWYVASGTYDASYNPSSQDVCGSLNLGGHSDWRLPSKKELITIVDYSIPYPGPTVDTTYFPNTNSSGYWTSTANAYDPGGAWYVRFSDAFVGNFHRYYGGHYVRCVRGGQPQQSFTDNGNGTVTDNRTGLTWQQGETGEMLWVDALSYCEGLSLGGFSDWRLPNIKELESITDDTRYNPAIDTDFFPDAHALFYLSSTTNAYEPFMVWGVLFYSGNVDGNGKVSSLDRYVRCVRGGQSGLIDLPQTGQIKCYDTAGTEIPCAGTGQDGEIQSGVAWPDPRFTVSGDCVTDNLTGLMLVKSPDSTARTWTGAVSYANGLDLCGYTDWRLPNINELRSLLHSGYNEETCGGAPCVDMSDWLNSKGFSNVQPWNYWSSTTTTGGSFAWIVRIVDGNVLCDPKTYIYYAWPVRGGEAGGVIQVPATGQTATYTPGDDGDLEKGVVWPSPRFHDNGNGTVTDNMTGIVWLKNVNCTDTMGGVEKGSGYLTWSNALTWSNSLASGACGLADGSTAGDWRLPNWEELESLIDFGRLSPALPLGHPFSNVQPAFYWSSTTDANGTGYAWSVSMWDGFVSFGYKTYYHYVWPVRGGQSGSVGNLEISPLSHDFGNVNMGISSPPQTFTVSNTGTVDLHISGISLSDTTNYIFNVNGGSNPCGSTTQTIAPNSSCTVTVTFSPSSTGQKPANLVINSDDPDTLTVSVSLTGNGVVPSTEIKLLVPNGGDVLPSGGTYGICWKAPSNAVKFDLQYTADGTSWIPIKTVIGLNCTHWDIPVVTVNKKKCRVKVIGYDSNSVKVGEDISDKPFTIEVMKVTSPDWEWVMKSGQKWTITWKTYMTVRPVANSYVYYTKNGGVTWKLIATLPENPEWYTWTVPSVATKKTNCKVKVVLKDAGGITVGKDVSDGFFTIKP